jgi:predicted NAD/FAD-dependent oxidoreductase
LSALETDIVIVGAGVAGLSCAGALAQAGRSVTVLERSRGVGGRCATRRVQGQPVDHGVAFIHGSTAAFRAALGAVEEAIHVAGWPRSIEGHGRPCQPKAFHPAELRLAFEEGVSAFPKHLARGLDIRLERHVLSLTAESDRVRGRNDDGAEWSARTVVLALALEQTRSLLAPLAESSRDSASICALLDSASSLPCLTVMAGYPPVAPSPAWDLCYPEDSPILQLISHDSAKRSVKNFTVLVAQAHPRWSRAHMEEDEITWRGEILAELSRLIGSTAGEPIWMQAHRWRYARADRGFELDCPPVIRFAKGARIGLVGDLFFPGGGIEAACHSGWALARRLLEEE